MGVDDDGLLTVGRLAALTGVPARTVRFWSDSGVLPPSDRSTGGYRLYDQNALARLELISTLRDLGIGLAAVEQIVNGQTTLAEALGAHTKALDAEIRLLKLRRSIIGAMARYVDTGKMPQMHKLAKNTAQERQKIIDEFVEEVFAGARVSDESQIIAEWMREMPAELPADPTPEQIQAWIELGELVADEGFRTALREMVLADQHNSKVEFGLDLRPRVLEHAGAAVRDNVPPDGPRAKTILSRILPLDCTPEEKADLCGWLEQITDTRIERYWQLIDLLNDRIPSEPAVPVFTWLLAALRDHG
ncbi:MerR family transcriptional regulator [Catenulispora yoronensis]|uniref:MerR family transcriptional regulator n=1 Tax=Catenulispora yoronensis TaxID=450799 RepID=A0ABP5FNE9_9ACTN